MSVYVYARSNNQEKNEEQIAACLSKARELGRRPGIKYVDIASGLADEYPEFEKLMSELKTGDIVICTSADRLSRKSTEAAEKIERIRKLGAKIIFVKP